MKTNLLAYLTALLFIGSCSAGKNTTTTTVTPTTTTSVPASNPVTLVNVQKVLSTYDISKNAQALTAIKAVPGITATQVDEALKYSTESNWPANIGTVSNRYTNRDVIKKYTAFKVATFPSAKGTPLYLIKIPAAQNASMPSGYNLAHDIYMVMTVEGFK